MIKTINRQSSSKRPANLVPNVVVERRSPEETRARILEVAWDLIRELGARATIADVADRLGMSSANVYRFYPSKQALSEAVAASQLGAIIAEGRRIAGGPGSASERFGAVLLMMYHCMRDQMVNQSRVHEIVDIAMSERWPAIEVVQAGLLRDRCRAHRRGTGARRVRAGRSALSRGPDPRAPAPASITRN